MITLTDQGKILRLHAGCLEDALLSASGKTPADLAALNRKVKELRYQIYNYTGSWTAPL